jgi:hypothetical protein
MRMKKIAQRGGSESADLSAFTVHEIGQDMQHALGVMRNTREIYIRIEI